MSNDKKRFNAHGLSFILATLLIMLLGGSGVGFYFGLTFVKNYSVEVNNRLIDAEASGRQTEELIKLRAQLEQSKALILKSDQIFSTRDAYQGQFLSDLQNYASASGVSIASTTFGDAASNDYSATVIINQPVGYSQLITFLHNIEGNLPKMQIQSISLKAVNGGDANSVETGDIKITMAVK